MIEIGSMPEGPSGPSGVFWSFKMRHTKEGITGLLYRKPLDFSNGAAAFPELIFHEISNG